MIRGAVTPDHPNTRKCVSMTIYSKKQDDYNKNPRVCNHCGDKIPYKKWRRKVGKYIKKIMFCGTPCSLDFMRMKGVVQYDADPNTCKQCGEIIPYAGRRNVFCNSSCAGSFNNRKRHENGYRMPDIARENLATLGNPGAWKTITEYFNPTENKIVTLESSWEVRVADRLGELSIQWTRPKPLPWVDKCGVRHLYFPDFYLPDYDLYLDPKNEFVMGLHEEKMAAVSLLVNIEYGHVDKIVSIVESLAPLLDKCRVF